MVQAQQQVAAESFVAEWYDKGNEKRHAQSFWLELLQKVYGVANPYQFIAFEEPTEADGSTKFVDGIIDDTHVLIEQKGRHVNLDTAEKQSDGRLLTPYQQAKRYADNLPYFRKPHYIVCCNFSEFHIYDMNETQPEKNRHVLLLEDLPKEFSRMSFLVDEKNAHLKKELELSVAAGKIVGEIYDAISPQYEIAEGQKTLSESQMRSLNILCVRLVFCLYAEDAGIFNSKNQFHDYLSRFEARDFRKQLIDLFATLDTKENERDKYLDDDLKAFPYVDGGLFEEKEIEIPTFTEDARNLILQKASEDFNWSEISPTIFGAVFESTLNPETRRSGGMHYTSIENIHKVIDPLFLDSFKHELDEVLAVKNENARKIAVESFLEKLSKMKFFDPACGSGNFLTETYLSLRRLENKALKTIFKGQKYFGEDFSPIRVKINQFYGIEINDFAVTVARTALWIAESQMMRETERIVAADLQFLPLKSHANIVEGNALRMDWGTLRPTTTLTNAIYADKANIYKIDDNSVLSVCQPPAPKYGEVNIVTREVEFKNISDIEIPSEVPVEFDYIMGNPPFVGARMMPQGGRQKREVEEIFGNIKDVQDLDYVTCWFKKAAQFIQGTKTEACFVATNSICQGSQVPILWNVLLNELNIEINFAYQSFKWDSESYDKAAVHCVIIGFSFKGLKSRERTVPKIIFDAECNPHEVENISPYLTPSQSIFVEVHKDVLCTGIPKIKMGNMARDGGNLLLEEEQKEAILKKEPDLEKWIRPLVGANEFLNGKKRYCFWLVKATPKDIKKSKILYDRVNAVKEFRLSSSAKTTNGYAKIPHLMAQIAQTGSDYIVIPKTTTSAREYIPIGFLDKNYISTDLVFIIPDATLYHFGVITSKVHMAWMRAVCGRFGMGYRYSKEIVYNNFIWCEPTDKQKAKIEKTAQAILDARDLFAENSLADLYDPLTMPPELRKAHQANDEAVISAYGWKKDITETEIVARLMQLYQKMVSGM